MNILYWILDLFDCPYFWIEVFVLLIIIAQEVVIYQLRRDKKELENLAGWRIKPNGQKEEIK